MKLLFNSYPHSGHINISQTLLRMLTRINLNNIEQLTEYQNWSTWKQDPMIFQGLYDGVSMFSVIREPLEVISLNSDRWFSGQTEKMVKGNVVFDLSKVNNSNVLSKSDIELINHQVRMYRSYVNCFEQRKQPILIIPYNEYLNNKYETLNSIIEFANIDNDLVDFNKIHVTPEIKEPTSYLHDQIKEVIKNNDNFQYISEWYQINNKIDIHYP
jgi:hypothetical protein